MADDVYSPSPKLRANLSVFAPNVPDSMPDEAGHYEPNTSRSNFHYTVPDEAYRPTLMHAGEAAPSAATPISPAANPYAARLTDLGNQLQSAYAAPHAGTARQIIGALFARKNPQLGGIISGETQRERKIEPLQQEYGLLSNIISANRAQQTADITNRLHEAQAEFYGPKTQALLNPPPKQTPQEQALQDYMGRVNPATKKNYTPAEALKQINQDAQDVKPDKTTPAKVNYDQGIPVSVTGADQKTYDINDPSLPPELEPLVTSANSAHSQHQKEVADQQARAFTQQEKMFQEHQNAPTASTKTMIETVPKVKALIAQLKPLADKETQGGGALGARWSDFWNNKAGAPNADYSKMRVNDGLLATALMRMHVGSRGGELMMQHFTNLLGLGHQSPENYKAALDAIDEYADTVAAEKPGATKPNATAPSNTPPTGAKVRDYTALHP